MGVCIYVYIRCVVDMLALCQAGGGQAWMGRILASLWRGWIGENFELMCRQGGMMYNIINWF